MNRTPFILFTALAILCLAEIGVSQTNDKSWALDNIDITLSREAREAVDAGVVLTFDCEFALREFWWLFSRENNTKLHRFTLTRHTLSNRYIVQMSEADTPHIFRSISEATNYIAAQARLLLESYSSEQNPYSMRISLNTFELPTPMRLKAFIADAWNLDTGWILWASAN